MAETDRGPEASGPEHPRENKGLLASLKKMLLASPPSPERVAADESIAKGRAEDRALLDANAKLRQEHVDSGPVSGQEKSVDTSLRYPPTAIEATPAETPATEAPSVVNDDESQAA